MAGAQPTWSSIVVRGPLVLACCGLVAIGCGDSGLDEAKKVQRSPANAQAAAETIDPAALIAAGKQSLGEGRYEQAIEQFTKALQQAHQDNQAATTDNSAADVYYQRGFAYLKMGFPDTAVEDFSDAINLDPQHAGAYQLRGDAYIALGDSYKAVRDCTTAIRLKPGSLGAYKSRGLVYLDRGQYDRAVADLEHIAATDPALAAEITPKLGEAYYGWSEQLTQAGEKDAAAEKFTKARQLNAPFVDSQIAATAPAEPPIEQTVAKPIIDEAVATFQRGRELQLEGRYDQALIEYAEAIALRRDYDEAYLRRGETLLTLGFPDTALEDLKRAAHRGAESAEAFRLEAKAFAALDNPHRAALSATDALHLDPTNAETYVLRGQAYTQLENWDRAIADLEEAIRRDPSLKQRVEPTLAQAKRGQAAAQNRSAGLQASSSQ